MNMKKIFVLLILAYFTATAQGSEATTTGSAFLRIPIGARASAMGEAFTPLANDATALYWNPAGICQLTKKQLSASHYQWLANLKHDFLGYSMPLTHKDYIGVFASALYAQDFEERISLSDLPIGDFSSTQAVVGLTYSRKITDFLRTGITLKGVYENIADETGSTAAIDIGALYHIPKTDFQLALALRHLGPGITFIDQKTNMPMTVSGGLAWSMIGGNIIIVAQAEKPTDFDPSFAFGLEATPVRMLKTRFGYNYTKDRDEQGGIAGFTLGLGFQTQGMNIDYAFVPYGDLGNTHRFSISFDMGKPLPPEPIAEKQEEKIVQFNREQPTPIEEKPVKNVETIEEKAPSITTEEKTSFPVTRKPPTPPDRISISPKSIVLPIPTKKVEKIEFTESDQIETDEQPPPVIEPSIRDLEKELTPEQLAKIHYDTGVAYHRKGDLEKAKEHYLKAIELNQYDPNPHANLAMVYLRLGQVEEARIELRKAKELEAYH